PAAESPSERPPSTVGRPHQAGPANLPALAPAVILDHMTEVTRILSALERGDAQAAEQLLPLVYDELRRLAAQNLAREKPGQTLTATSLVHEAYLRLVGTEEPGWAESKRWKRKRDRDRSTR